MKIRSFRELFNESIKVSNNNASKYFKMIQKATKSKLYNIETSNDSYVVEFRGGKEDFSLLVDTTKGKDGWLVGYQFGENNGTFRMIPANFTSVKDIISDYRILKMAKGKSLPAKAVIKNAETQIKLAEPDSDFDFENDKYGAVKYGKLYRIYAKKSFDYIKKGDKGGWIAQESNLSEKGNCWIYNEAKVYGDAKVYDNAKVYGSSEVFDDARVFDNARVFSSAQVYGNAQVFDDARVFDYVRVFSNVQVFDDAQVYGNAQVFDDAQVFGNAEVYGYAKVFEHALVFEHAEVSEHAQVYGYAKIYGNAEVSDNAEASGNAEVFGDAKVYDNAEVFSNGKVFGDDVVSNYDKVTD